MKEIRIFRLYIYIRVIITFLIIFPALTYVYTIVDPRNSDMFNLSGYLSGVIAAYCTFLLIFFLTKSYQRLLITSELIDVRSFGKSITKMNWNEVVEASQTDGLYAKMFVLTNNDASKKIVFFMKKKHRKQLINLCTNSHIKEKLNDIFFK